MLGSDVSPIAPYCKAWWTQLKSLNSFYGCLASFARTHFNKINEWIFHIWNGCLSIAQFWLSWLIESNTRRWGAAETWQMHPYLLNFSASLRACVTWKSKGMMGGSDDTGLHFPIWELFVNCECSSKLVLPRLRCKVNQGNRSSMAKLGSAVHTSTFMC